MGGIIHAETAYVNFDTTAAYKHLKKVSKVIGESTCSLLVARISGSDSKSNLDVPKSSVATVFRG